MIAVITGDIIDSRKVDNAGLWLTPFKQLLNTWGASPQTWEIYRGDSFQVKITNVEAALWHAIFIKALIKSIAVSDKDGATGRIDVRMAIGIGDEHFKTENITENNGEAFVRSGDKFEQLKSEKVNLSIQSPWPDWDVDMNLKLRLALTIMDNWSINSAELMTIILKQPELKQTEISKILGIEQNSVSGRYTRAYAAEILALEKNFREQIKKNLP